MQKTVIKNLEWSKSYREMNITHIAVARNLLFSMEILDFSKTGLLLSIKLTPDSQYLM